MKESKRKIIKEKKGELGYIDCHHLNKSIHREQKSRKLYLVCIIDDYSGIA